jgi:FAD/FMN-containing dehydrogenase
MRSLIAGVEAVLADGSIHSGLAALKKDNRGYNLDQLLIGSEGTLGIITAVALKLVPSIYSRAVAWVGLASPENALSLLRFCEAKTDRIEGFELVPADCLELVLDHIPGTRSPLERQHAWNVLIEATSDREELNPSELLQSLLTTALDAKLIEDATIAANEAQAEAFWKLRDGIAEAERADGPSAAHDISVPVSDMPRFIEEASAAVEAAFPGTRASAFGHLGDGNVHFHVRGPAGSGRDWLEEAGPPVLRFVDDLVTAAGGSISAEHGIGQMKRAELERLGNPGDLAAMRAIKRALDPLGIMNPGKLVG